MNHKPGLEFTAPWWKGTRLFYSPGPRTLVVELPDRTTRIYRDVPAQVYELVRQSPELNALPVTEEGRRNSFAEA
jgi:hypothetical protein